MTDFLNPLGGRFIGMTSPVAPTTVSGTIPDPPRSFLLLDPGTIIKGVVIGREGDGLTAIATDKGTVRVASNAPLPPGTNVTLEVRPTGDRLQVLILNSDAVRPPAGAANQVPAPTAGIPPQPPSPGGTPPSPPPGNAATPPTSAPVTSPAGAPPTGSTGTPSSGTATPPPTQPANPAPAPAPSTPSIQIVGSSQNAIVLHPQSITPVPGGGQARQPAQQVTLPNGQVIILPLPAATPDQPAGPGTTPVAPQPPQAVLAGQQSGQQPAQPPVQLPAQATVPIARPPMQAPGNTQLTGEVQQRILALFQAAPQSGTQLAQPIAAHAQLGQPVTLSPDLAAKLLPPGAELQLRVIAVQIGSQHPIEIDPAAQLSQNGKESHIVFGRVVAMTPAGHAVIHTPVGDLMMQQRSSLPVGAQLAIGIDAVEAAQSASVAMPPPVIQTPQQALLLLSRSWPTLADLLAILQGGGPGAAKADGIDPALARQILAHLPQMGPRLGAGMVAAMAALRSGDLGRLMGPLLASRGLGVEREEIVRRLRGEFSQLSALAQERPEAEWRALFLPYVDDQQRVQRINLFYRRHGKGEQAAEKGGGTRFVVEADFTRLGPFQLDGLMRDKRFDLMVRSRLRVDERMRRDIEAIYEEARGLTGFTGSIAFQTVDNFPISPLEDLKRAASTVTI